MYMTSKNWTETMDFLSVSESLTLAAGYGLIFFHVWPPDLFHGMAVWNVLASLLLHYGLPRKDSDLYRLQDPGLWCACLLPCLVATNLAEDVPLLQLLVHLSLLLYACTCVQVNGFPAVCCWLLVLLYTIICTAYNYSDLTGLMLGAGVLHLVLSWTVPRRFSTSFTFGELSLVTQLLAYCFYRTLTHLHITKGVDVRPLDLLATVVVIGVAMVVVITYIATSIRLFSQDPCCLLGMWTLSVILVAVVICLPAVYLLIGPSHLYKLFLDLFVSQTSIFLLVWWLFCSSLSVGVVCFYGNHQSKKDQPRVYKTSQLSAKDSQKEICAKGIITNSKRHMYDRSDKTYHVCQEHGSTFKTNVKQSCDSKKCDNNISSSSKSDDLTRSPVSKTAIIGNETSSSVRKYFHAAILCVYVPGLVFHRDLLYLASVVAVGVFVIVEAVRVLEMLYLGETLTQYLQVFLDEQDQGDLMLTPIYLLIGCSLPLWLISSQSGADSSIIYYAGLLSVGVGDSFASVVGRKYGRIRLPGSKKSLEGTIASVFSQLVALLLLQVLVVPGSTLSWSLVVSVVLTSSLEACTSQIDNLAVPAFALLLFNNIPH